MERKRKSQIEIKSEGYLIVDKRMLRLFGPNLAVFMSNLIDKYFYWKEHSKDFDGTFFLTHEQQTNQTGLSDHQIRQCKRQAVLNKWIDTRYKGSPAREWYELLLESPDIQVAIEFLNGKTLNSSRARRQIPKDHLIKTNNKYYYSPEGEQKNNNIPSDGRITSPMFEEFWNIYPKKTDKGKANSAWNKLCSKDDRPTWVEIRNAIHHQKSSERWKDTQFIPHPSTWLSNSRWLDDPKEMKGFHKVEHKEPIYDDGRKYVWDDKIKHYVHSVSREIYIP